MEDLNFSEFKDYIPWEELLSSDYSKDFGYIKQQKPLGIFLPTDAMLLSQFVQLASKWGVSVSCRGQAHSVYGQSLCENGVIVDLTHIEETITIKDSQLIISAGKTWQEAILFAMKHGMILPVLTDYLKLSIGGTLSLAGFGGSSYLHGSQADNIIDMNVISPKHGLIIDTKKNAPELFHATLCGLGQFGIITRVKLPLLPLKPYVKLFKVHYSTLEDFIRDQQYLFKQGIFSHLKGFITKIDNNWQYIIEAAIFSEKPNPIPETSLSKLLSDKIETEDMLYADFISQVTDYVDKLNQEHKLQFPHPWYNVFLPENAILSHLQLALNNPYLTGTEPILVYPLNSAKLQQPYFIKPKGKTIYLFSLMYNCSYEAIPNFPYKEVLKHNYFLYQNAQAKGGCRYPFDAIPFDSLDWQRHFQDKWPGFLRLKNKYDPKHILAKGVLQA